MRTVRIIVGMSTGCAIGIALECINGFFTFLLPPYLILLPLSVISGGIIGALIKNDYQDFECNSNRKVNHSFCGDDKTPD